MTKAKSTPYPSSSLPKDNKKSNKMSIKQRKEMQ